MLRENQSSYRVTVRTSHGTDVATSWPSWRLGPPHLHIPGILSHVFDPNKQKPLHGNVVTFLLAEAGQNIFCVLSEEEL